MEEKIFKLSDTTALIVTYLTDTDRLSQILKRLVLQCDVVLCDNSDNNLVAEKIATCARDAGVIYLGMGDNLGIAYAQNYGISYCWQNGSQRVLLLDDDSTPSESIVKDLEGTLNQLDNKLVVLSARTTFAGTDISNSKISNDNLTLCRDLMSSGTLITRDVFDLVGHFDESLFIDCVDFDWGWRAQKRGVNLYLVSNVVIEHKLGIGQISVGPFFMRLPSPIRHYYQFRNILRMMFRTHTPWGWRFSQTIRLPLKALILVLAAPKRRLRLAYAFSGIADAIRGRAGKIPLPK